MKTLCDSYLQKTTYHHLILKKLSRRDIFLFYILATSNIILLVWILCNILYSEYIDSWWPAFSLIYRVTPVGIILAFGVYYFIHKNWHWQKNVIATYVDKRIIKVSLSHSRKEMRKAVLLKSLKKYGDLNEKLLDCLIQESESIAQTKKIHFSLLNYLPIAIFISLLALLMAICNIFFSVTKTNVTPEELWQLLKQIGYLFTILFVCYKYIKWFILLLWHTNFYRIEEMIAILKRIKLDLIKTSI